VIPLYCSIIDYIFKKFRILPIVLFYSREKEGDLVKKVLTFSSQILILIVIYQIGSRIGRFLQLQIPGNVIGILLLLVLLWTRVIKLEQIDFAATWLLKHLSFFFIPIAVGLMTLGPIFLHKGIIILFVLVTSAFIGLLSAGKATQSVIMKKEKAKVKYHDHSL
jgi:holin-like protein